MLTFTALKTLLQNLNHAWLNDLRENTGLQIEAREDVTGSGSGQRNPPEAGRERPSVVASLADHHCFCGRLKGKRANAIDLAQGSLIHGPTYPKLYGVLNVLDQRTVDVIDALPVVLCVGVNYGQVPTSIGVGITDHTGMFSNLPGAAKLIADECSDCLCNLPKDFHLVATNFFPWLSIKEWSSLRLNTIQEALLLHCFGDSDPASRVRNLIFAVKPHSVIFHGANNCVPTMALSSIRSIGPVTNLVLCDNLSRPVTNNAVKLC